MSLNSSNCARLLLKEYFGEIVSDVAKCLTTNGSQTMAYIRKQTNLPMSKISESIRALIQHNMVTFKLHKRGYVEYALDLQAVLALIRYPKYIQCGMQLDAEPANFFIPLVLRHGQITMSDAIEGVITRLKQDLTDQSKIPYQPTVEAFEKLVNLHFLRRCPMVAPDHTDTPETYAPVPAMELTGTSMYKIPQINHQLFAMQLSAMNNEDVKEPARKKMRLEDPNEKSDDGIYWRVNFDRIHQYLRDQLIVSAIENQMDKDAAEVVRFICYSAETVTEDWAASSNMISFYTIAQEMKKSGREMQELVLKQHLRLLCESTNGFITKEQDSQGGMYAINFKKAITELTWTTIESIVQERFGSKCLRIFRLIRSKTYVELQEIERLAMMNAKETKESTYKLLSQNFIQTAEISQTADHAPSKSFYLFHIKLAHIVQTLLEWCYKATANVIQLREAELTTNRRLLEKSKRVNSVMHGKQFTGEADESQWRDAEEEMTPLEHGHIEKIMQKCNKLELGQAEMESTIFVFELFLKYLNKKL